MLLNGDRGNTVFKVLCYKSEGPWFDPSWCQWIFHWHKILPIALWPWSRLSLEKKWVPGAFPEGKSGRCVRLTNLPPSCAVVTKSGSLNFLDPSGTVQACNGTALYADKHVGRAWISFRYLSSYNRCSHWSVRTCISFWVTLYSGENVNFIKLFRY